MTYLKIKIADVNIPNKFYRTVLVNPGLNLYQFSIYIELLLKAAFCHMAMFEGDKVEFIDELWIGEFADPDIKSYDYTKVSIKEALKISPKLTFTYDTGDLYVFDLIVIEEFNFPLRKNLILLEASGEGIWEDNHSGLNDFIEGKIKYNDIFAWNLNIPDIKTYDFFKPIDIEKINDKIDLERKRTIKMLKIKDSYSDND